jgi:HSP20 family molecular chaperone IbpA
MHTIIHPTRPELRSREAEPASLAGFRKPHYDCRGETGAVQLVVYIPGVDAAGVSIEARGPDLTVTARKTRFVRVNWQALHLEGSQRDYRLRLRLGSGFDYQAMQAEIHHGVLTVTLPRRQGSQAGAAARWRRVA